jgi:hypothetical protein
MQLVRRLYFYAVTFVSLEVVIWGVIGLLRSAFAEGEVGGDATRLAGALALILVGIPVFLAHWWWVQRNAGRDIQERFSRLRAIFLYGVILVNLVPVAQNTLVFFNHLFLSVFGLPGYSAIMGANQSLTDNLVAIVVNGIAALYFYVVLQKGWRESQSIDTATPGNIFVANLVRENFSLVRRIFRYFLLLYGLLMASAGIQQTLQFIIAVWGTVGRGAQSMLAAGLALLIVGVPIWIGLERTIQRSLVDDEERRSLLRLVILYLVVFVSATVLLSAVGRFLYEIFRLILGVRFEAIDFLARIAAPFALAVSAGLVFFFYNRNLGVELRSEAVSEGGQPNELTAEQQAEWQRRGELRRLYYYGLALLGLGATFIGLFQMFSEVLALMLTDINLADQFLQNSLAAALAMLVVGLPLWIIAWRPVQAEAIQLGESGDLSRRSVIRKSYLYLVLFVGVIGVMFSAGALLNTFLRSLLGDPPFNLWLDILQGVKALLLFGVFGVYHGWILRNDGRLAEQSLFRKHSQYPLLILAPDEGEFAEVLIEALNRHVPGLPVAVHLYSQGVPDESLSSARAVIMPVTLVTRPSEALRLWMQNFAGERLVLPTPIKGWFWIGVTRKTLESQAVQVSKTVRRLAEGLPADQAARQVES